ncbi:MAG: hypothetical protein IRZ11_01150 [Clostridia bacterium]|nr:hypothetical protein [Clostridia bacterium]
MRLPPPTPEVMARMGEFMEEMSRRGVLVATGGMMPSSEGAQIRLADGKFTVTDGPFAEAKELVGGWALIDVPSKEEAVEVAKRFLAIVGEGEARIRRVMGGPDDFQGA